MAKRTLKQHRHRTRLTTPGGVFKYTTDADALMQARGRPRIKMGWPSGLRRYVKAVVRKGVGSNPTLITCDSLSYQSIECVFLSFVVDDLGIPRNVFKCRQSISTPKAE